MRTPVLYTVAFRLAFAPLRTIFRLEVDGLAHLPESGGFVVSANHLSNVDPWIVASALWPRMVHYMGKVELFNPLLRPLAESVGVFPVRRGVMDRDAVPNAVEQAVAGQVVGIFVEGTRRSKGLRKKHAARPHDGPAWVAMAAGVPLIPAGIAGSDRLTRLRQWRIRFGPAVDLNGLASLSPRGARTEATKRLWTAISMLEAQH